MDNHILSTFLASFRNRDLAFLFSQTSIFDIAPRDLHPACRGMGYVRYTKGDNYAAIPHVFESMILSFSWVV